MKKKITPFLMAVLLLIQQLAISQITWHGVSSTTPAGQAPKSGTAYYSQLSPASSSYMMSQSFIDTASSVYSSQAADDFTVPAGQTWNITNIDIIGTYFAFTGAYIDGLNVCIYSNVNGAPGNEIICQQSITTYNEVSLSANNDSYRYEISLPQTINLTEGTYWLSVEAIGDMTVMDRWGWRQVSGPIIGKEFHWRNPEDGFGTNMTEWGPASLLLWADLNLSFALYRQGQSNDLALSSIISPISGASLNSTETVIIDVKNESNSTINNFSVSYMLNNGLPVVQNISGANLGANQHMNITFTSPVNLTAAGQHTISASVALAGDPRPENNTLSTTIYNLTNEVKMVPTGNQTLNSCNFTFTDSGGLAGDLNQDDNATTVFHPANAGDRIRLSFADFNIGYNQVILYNGSSTSAPVINYYNGEENPGIITAFNAEGALTLDFTGFGEEPAPGWAAWVECITPYANDFEVSEFIVSPNNCIAGQTQTLKAVINNLGTLTLSKEVLFKLDGNILTAIVSQPIPPLGSDTISFTYTPTVIGTHTLTSAIPNDDNPELNNSLSTTTETLPWSLFFEDFEGEAFPPANWYQTGNWFKDDSSPYSGLFAVTGIVPNGSTDTLFSCRVNVGQDAHLTFAAVSNLWFTGGLDVYWIDEATGNKTLINTPTLSGLSFQSYDLTLNNITGIGRFAFVSYVNSIYATLGMVTIDYIQGTGMVIHKEEHDIRLTSFKPTNLVSQLSPSNYHLTVHNNGIQDIADGEYTVNLYIAGTPPLLVASALGEALTFNETFTYDITTSIDSILQSSIYAVIDYPEDQFISNNTSEEKLIAIVAPNSIIKQSPLGEPITSSPPIDFLYQHNLSQTIYAPNEIGNTGTIFGMTYHYNFQSLVSAPNVTIWMGMTDIEEISEWLPLETFTQVYTGSMDFKAGDQTIYIPFSTPFNYNDNSKRLAVMVKHDGIDSYNGTIYYSYPADGVFASIFISDPDNSFDPANLTFDGCLSGEIPESKFVFNDEITTLSGLITATDGTPIPNASLTISGLNLLTTSDATGHYQFDAIPAGTYQITIEKTGYFPSTDEIILVASQPATRNFILLPMTTVTVEGRVTSADSPTFGLAGATVTITGYATFSTSTNVDGTFVVEGVYTQNSYTLTASATNYMPASIPLVIIEDSVNVGDIILNEAMLLPYSVTAAEVDLNSFITWKAPSEEAYKVMQTDDGIAEDGYAAEPSEEVSLGNKFNFTEPTTLSSISLYFKPYTGTPKTLTVDIYDEDMKLIATSEEFNSTEEAWVTVDVPNRTLSGVHYIMVHWPGYSTQSTFLGYDKSLNTANNAYYYYPNGTISLLSDLSNIEGSFLMHLNILKDGKNSNTAKSLLGYSITKGRVEDLANVASWPILNTAILTSTSFTDSDWSNSHTADWIYGVKSHFTTGESEWVFSNTLLFLAVGIEDKPNTSISIHPNPTSDYIVIEGAQGKNYSLTTSDGKILLSSIVSSNKQTIGLSGVAPGSYLIVLTDGNTVTTHKVIVR